MSGPAQPGPDQRGGEQPGAGSVGPEVIAAVDIAGGLASQVLSGAEDDPAAVAQQWLDEGAHWLHIADLDRAFDRGHNDEVVHALLRRFGRAAHLQISGGIDSAHVVQTALDLGAARVVLSSAVLADPELAGRLVAIDAERVALGIDVRDGLVVVRGRRTVLGPVETVLATVPRSARWAVVADASRDGAQSGVDIELFSTVGRLVDAELVASGGVAGLDDLRALQRRTNVRAVVLGAVLHHGVFTVAQARAAIEPKESTHG